MSFGESLTSIFKLAFSGTIVTRVSAGLMTPPMVWIDSSLMVPASGAQISVRDREILHCGAPFL